MTKKPPSIKHTVTTTQTVESYNTRRSQLLDRAMEITHHDRNANYGNPEDNFQHIANLWNSYIKVRRPEAPLLSPADVAVMNMLIKVARLGNNPDHYDSAVDIAGYAACLADCQCPGVVSGMNLSKGETPCTK